MKKDGDNSGGTRPVKVPIEDVIDLHTFLPNEIPGLLEEYLNACKEAGIYSVRIIHGKGKGHLRNRVHSLLNKMPIVDSFSQASHAAGGWGATIVELKKEFDFESPQWAQCLDQGARTMGALLKPRHIAQFAVHARELMAWNLFANLTAITDPLEIAVKQFLDAVPVCAIVPQGSRVLDIGSGGGFPGIPLKIMRPDLCLTLIDASRKKVSFLKHVIRVLELECTEARHVHTTELAREIERQPSPRTTAGGERDDALRYDVVISKAAFNLGSLVDQAVQFLRRPGLLIAMKGKAVEAELKTARAKIDTEGLDVSVKTYRLPYLDIKRSLVILTCSA